MKVRQLLVTAAATGIAAGLVACGSPKADVNAPTTSAEPASDHHCCKGKNACKGQSGCKTDSNASCAGQNTCRGIGTSCPKS